jgi:hypothetical protein
VNDQIKAWVARHSREVGFAVEALQAHGNTNHARDLRESWEPMAAAMAARPVITRAQAVTIACALCADGNIHEQADAVLRIANETPGDDGANTLLTEAVAREWADQLLPRGPIVRAGGMGYYEMLAERIKRTILAASRGERPTDVGPVTEGAALKPTERTGHGVLAANPANLMTMDAMCAEAKAAMAADDAEEDAIQEDVRVMLTVGEHRALARLHRAAAACLAQDFTLDGFDFDDPRDMAKRAGEIAKQTGRLRDCEAMVEMRKAATGYAMVKEVADKERARAR